MKKIIFIIIVYLITFDAYASFKVFVDRTNVFEGEDFNLTINVDGNNNNNMPDISILKNDFDILGTSRQTSVQVINNNFSNTNSFIFSLKPKNIGTFTIPSFKINNQTSQPITINVLKFDPKAIGIENNDLFVKAYIDNENPYEKEQVIYTVKIFDKIGTINGQINTPSTDDNLFKVEKLDKVISYGTVIDGVGYNVFEGKIAFFPLKDGEMEIPASTYNAEVIEKQQNNNFGGRRDIFEELLNNRMSGFQTNLFNQEQQTKKVKFSSNTLKMNVKKAYNNTFLPAKEITIEENIEPLTLSFKEGDTITRTITVNAKGQIAENLPKINMEASSDYKIYPSKEEQGQSFDENYGFVSFKKRSFVIIPTKTGKINIPEFQVSWYNSDTKKMEIAKTKTLELDIAKQDLKEEKITENINKIEEETKNIETIDTAKQNENKTDITKQIKKDLFNIYTYSLASIIILLLVILLIIISKKNQNKNITTSNREVEIDFNYKKAFKQAINKNDALDAKNVAINWYNYEFKSSFTTIEAIAKEINNDELKKEIDNLNLSLYSKYKSTWKGDNFYDIFISSLKKRKEEEKKQPVPNLYPF